MYEHHKEPVLPRQQFRRRAARHGWVRVLIILLSLGIGPVSTLTSDAATLFASRYPLYSGIVFVAATGVLFAPFLHRVLHLMHATDQGVA